MKMMNRVQSFQGPWHSLQVWLESLPDHVPDEAGQKLLESGYLLPGETWPDLVRRVAAGDWKVELLLRKGVFFPASPILTNRGTDRGDCISCFVGEIEDSLYSIQTVTSHNAKLMSKGGGTGLKINVREGTERAGFVGKARGTTALCKLIEASGNYYSQGDLRRANSAVYLDIDHPEIEQFLDLRRPEGDPNLRALNIHHGVCISDSFMEAVRDGKDFNLMSRGKDRTKIVKTVKARALWEKLLTTRAETGEPYIVFIDNVNRGVAPFHRGKVTTSNLCTEIMLDTKGGTNICCLSSLNFAVLFEFIDFEGRTSFRDAVLCVMEVITEFLETVLDEHYEKPGRKDFDLGHIQRPLGIGVMGVIDAVQEAIRDSIYGFDYEKQSVSYIEEIFNAYHEAADKVLNARPWLTTITSIAPTASISTIAGCSPSIEWPTALVYTRRDKSGTTVMVAPQVRNIKDDALREQVIGRVKADGGVLTYEAYEELGLDRIKPAACFNTAYQVPLSEQLFVFELANRVHQGSSNNLFFSPKNKTKVTLHDTHFAAWKKGIKSLYYLRTDVSGKIKAEEPKTCNLDGECRSCS